MTAWFNGVMVSGTPDEIYEMMEKFGQGIQTFISSGDNISTSEVYNERGKEV